MAAVRRGGGDSWRGAGDQLDDGVAVGGGVARRRGQAAPARPRSGPFRPHLGLGGPTAGRVGGAASRRRGSGDGRWGAGGAGAALLQRGRRDLAGSIRAWPGRGWPGMPCCCVRTATMTAPEARASCTTAEEVVPSRAATALLLPSSNASSSFSWPRGGDLSEAAWVALRPRWRMLVDGELVGWLRSGWAVGFGVGRNPCRIFRLRCGDACGCHHSSLEGAGGLHSPLPSVCWGKP